MAANEMNTVGFSPFFFEDLETLIHLFHIDVPSLSNYYGLHFKRWGKQ